MIPIATYPTTRTHPKRITDQEATYRAALKLVTRIDKDLTRGTGHYYTKSGRLLVKLDEVIRAILRDDLMIPEGVAA